jgi:pSer/pThr/pTyr-binding forkhead associated (FHA) protein
MMLRDTGSHNGTYLNGGKTRVTEIELQSGDILEMGSETLRVCVQAL